MHQPLADSMTLAAGRPDRDATLVAAAHLDRRHEARPMKHVAVFARRPGPGRVKTRLTPALPPEMALELHCAMLGDTLVAVAQAGADRRHLYWDEPAGETGLAIPAGFRETHQAGADLGERLERAFQELLSGSADRSIVVGTDCPELDVRLLDQALASLDAAELVLGPTHDGGYYLIGLSRRAPAIFRGISWGTDQVLEQTLDRAGEVGLSRTLLPQLSDLDTPEDLVRLIARHLVRGGKLPARTAAALARMGLLLHSG
jgi:hypothetical protein